MTRRPGSGAASSRRPYLNAALAVYHSFGFWVVGCFFVPPLAIIWLIGRRLMFSNRGLELILRAGFRARP